MSDNMVDRMDVDPRTCSLADFARRLLLGMLERKCNFSELEFVCGGHRFTLGIELLNLRPETDKDEESNEKS